jgi:NitT/TauT family transport system ATP-binding protein
MIRLESICKTFVAIDGAEINALDHVSLEIVEGEFVSLVGPSGCGKTTLLEIIAGLNKPGHGKVSLNGNELNGRFGWAGYMSQVDTLMPWRTVMENAEVGLEVSGIPKNLRRKRVSELIEQVGLRGFEDKYPSEISGGMRKRLGLVRMLAYDPKVLLLDEPFAALDALTRELLQEDLLRLWQTHKRTVIFVTHDLVEAITLSDRIILLSTRPGRVKRTYSVSLPRPRESFEIQFNHQFLQLHQMIRRDLLEEMRDFRRRDNGANEAA